MSPTTRWPLVKWVTSSTWAKRQGDPREWRGNIQALQGPIAAGFWPWKLWEMGPSHLIRGTDVKWQGQLKTRCCTLLQPLSWHAVFLCVLLQMFQFDDTLDVSELPRRFERSFISNHRCYPPPKWAPKPLEKMLSLAAEQYHPDLGAMFWGAYLNGCVCRPGDGKTGQSGSWELLRVR